MTNYGGIGSSGICTVNKVYRIQGSDYNGCDGWNSWLTDDVYISRQAAEQDCHELNSRNNYSRYKVIEAYSK